MAAHGRTGEALQQYRDRKRRPREVRVPDSKTGKMTTVTAKGRYGKTSYVKRLEKRAEQRKKAA